MPIYQQMPIRLQADLISAPPVVPIDANTGLSIKFWRAQSVSIQVGIFDSSGEAVDLSNLEYLQLVLQEAQTSLVPALTVNVLAGAIIPTITVANWQAGIAAQATFNLTPAQTDFSLGGSTEATYWLRLLGRTSGGGNIVYAAGPVTIYNPGLPPQPPIAFVSAEEIANGGGNFEVTPESQVHIAECTITGPAETRDVVVHASGLIAGARVSLRFILPATAGINLRIFDQSTAGDLLTTITTTGDGFLPTSRVELWFDGANLKRDFLLQPAFGLQT